MQSSLKGIVTSNSAVEGVVALSYIDSEKVIFSTSLFCGFIINRVKMKMPSSFKWRCRARSLDVSILSCGNTMMQKMPWHEVVGCKKW